MKARNFNSLIRKIIDHNEIIDLHPPVFNGNEKKYLNKAIESTYVSSSVYIDKFEKNVSFLTKNKFCVATVNGTSAIHIALALSNAKSGDEA